MGRLIENFKYMKIGLKCSKITSLKKRKWKARKCTTALQAWLAAWVGKSNAFCKPGSVLLSEAYKRPSTSSHHHALIIIIIIIIRLSNPSCQNIHTYAKMDKICTNLQSNVPNSNRNTRLNVLNPYAPHKDVLSSTGAACNLWGPVAPEECNTHLKREAVHSRPPSTRTNNTNKP